MVSIDFYSFLPFFFSNTIVKKSLWLQVFIIVLNEDYEKLIVVSEDVSSFSGKAALN